MGETSLQNGSGCKRVSTWRSRGCLPILIEATASIAEIQQMDSHFREASSESDLLADDMLMMTYCMTIMRLMNDIMEKTRKKNEISVGEAVDVIGIPRMMIDIRHECSHHDLPSLRLVRLASTKIKGRVPLHLSSSAGDSNGTYHHDEKEPYVKKFVVEE
ncbi:ribosomal biogenesis protein LAS1L-like protein isoform X2 [Tanacetum coccineum]